MSTNLSIEALNSTIIIDFYELIMHHISILVEKYLLYCNFTNIYIYIMLTVKSK